MNTRFGLYVTYLVYLFSVLGILYSFIHPLVANAWFNGSITINFEKPKEEVVEKTLDSEIDRLSVKYGVASSTARAVIKCESAMYGTAVNHNRLPDGTIWSSDFGNWQINDYFHKEDMDKLGLNIYNEWDSLEYGFILFKQQGLAPWSASRACWSKLIK